MNNIETKIDKWSNEIIILENNTNNIIEYVENNPTKKISFLGFVKN